MTSSLRICPKYRRVKPCQQERNIITCGSGVLLVNETLETKLSKTIIQCNERKWRNRYSVWESSKTGQFLRPEPAPVCWVLRRCKHLLICCWPFIDLMAGKRPGLGWPLAFRKEDYFFSWSIHIRSNVRPTRGRASFPTTRLSCFTARKPLVRFKISEAWH